MHGARIGEVVHVLLDPSQNNGSDIAPALVVRTWGDPFELDGVERQPVNLRVHGDSAETLWLTSVALFADRPSPEQLERWSAANKNGYRTVAYQPSHPLAATIGNFLTESSRLMDFGRAVAALRAGARVSREGFNAPGQWLILVPGSTITVIADRPLGLAAPELVGQQVVYKPHIDIMTAQGSLVPWLASQSDVLAEDWYVVTNDESA
jgi:hypothetical protein